MGLGQVILDWCFDPSNLPLVLVGIVLVGMLFVRLARKVGVKSNAVNWAAPLPSETGADRTVTELWIYPVKSMAGVSVQSVEVTETGFAKDREWMVVNQWGTFQSQRTIPALCRVQPTLAADGLSLYMTGQPRITAHIVRADDAGAELRTVTVWDQEITGAVDQGDAVAEWLSTALETPNLRLVRMDESCRRQSPEKYCVPGLPNSVTFPDGFPFLITTNATLDALNAALPATATPVPMNRFRPNVVIQGPDAAWDEDSWAAFTIGDLKLRGTKQCSRCAIPTIDQFAANPGSVEKEPIKTLRRVHGSGPRAYFGINAAHVVESASVVSVGEPLTLFQRSELVRSIK